MQNTTLCKQLVRFDSQPLFFNVNCGLNDRRRKATRMFNAKRLKVNFVLTKFRSRLQWVGMAWQFIEAQNPSPRGRQPVHDHGLVLKCSVNGHSFTHCRLLFFHANIIYLFIYSTFPDVYMFCYTVILTRWINASQPPSPFPITTIDIPTHLIRRYILFV